jgi:antitoxin CptB
MITARYARAIDRGAPNHPVWHHQDFGGARGVFRGSAAGRQDPSVEHMSETNIMTGPAVSVVSKHDDLDVRRKRLLFRSWHRGTQESDLILGSFAESCLSELDRIQLDRLEALLDCADVDLVDWVIGGNAVPKEYDHELTWLLRAFCANRHSKPWEHEHPQTTPTMQEQS